MPQYLTPGIYVEESSDGPRPIAAVGTATAAFIGEAPLPDACAGAPVAVGSWDQFREIFVGENRLSTPLSHAVAGYFLNGGSRAYVVNTEGPGLAAALDALAGYDDIALIAAPGWTDPASYDALLTHCERLTTCFAILDGPATCDDITALTRIGPVTDHGGDGAGGDTAPGLRPRDSARGYGAVYVPHLMVHDPLEPENVVPVAPSGHLAGIYARSDAERGVFRAPASIEVLGALGLTQHLNANQQGVLNPAGVNAIRVMTGRGVMVWGARTLSMDPEWRYISVRRLLIMLETSIRRGTQWAVFQPNNERLWNSLRRDVSAFLMLLWRQGAFPGSTPEQAFFVRCDRQTNSPATVAAGRVVIEIGVAPLSPAEFTIFRITHCSAETL
ncbi:MAG: phage tail sheath family protein [Paracoccus sp. (in: a-proteobacteria)]